MAGIPNPNARIAIKAPKPIKLNNNHLIIGWADNFSCLALLVIPTIDEDMIPTPIKAARMNQMYFNDSLKDAK